MKCNDCRRHIGNLPEVAALLTEDHKDALQLALCDDRAGGACPGDPWGEE